MALRGLDEPLLLDEWQEVPEVLGAVKRAVDRDPRPGRYLRLSHIDHPCGGLAERDAGLAKWPRMLDKAWELS